MNKRITGAIVGGVAAVVMGSGIAYASVAAGPPTNQSPAEYGPGVIYLCVNQTTQALRLETRTDVPGNCAANEIQLPITVPTPYPTPPAP
jgi:hypothetical protein